MITLQQLKLVYGVISLPMNDKPETRQALEQIAKIIKEVGNSKPDRRYEYFVIDKKGTQ